MTITLYDMSKFREKYIASSTPELEHIIKNNKSYGEFMINAALLGIPWGRIVSDRSIKYFFQYKAFRILGGLLSVSGNSKERKKVPVDDIIANALYMFGEDRLGLEGLKFLLKAYAESGIEYPEKRLSRIVTKIGFENFLFGSSVDFITISCKKKNGNNTFFNHYKCHGYEFRTIDDLVETFETLFPNGNIISKRLNTWTDDRDGNVYRTVRIKDTEWLATPIKFGMDEDGTIDRIEGYDRLKDIIPYGWRLPTLNETVDIWPMKLNRWGGYLSTAALIDKNSGWKTNSSDFAMMDGTRDEELGASGFAIPTTHVGQTRRDTVCTFFLVIDGKVESRYLSLLTTERPNRPDTFDSNLTKEDREKIFSRACVLLYRTVDNTGALY
jgi:hypothetical protein